MTTDSFETAAENQGLLKRENGAEIDCALKFILKKRTQDNAAGSDSTSDTLPPVGSVTATFHETIYFDDMEEYEDCDETERLNEALASAPAVE